MEIKVRMPGEIISYEVQVGDAVKQGDILAYMEAMKMKHRILAPRDGCISKIIAPLKTRVSAGTVIIKIE